MAARPAKAGKGLHSRALATLDETNYGIIVLNRSGRVIFSNEAAGSILREGDAIFEQDGQLRTAVPTARLILEQAITSATRQMADAADGNVVMLPRAGRAPIIISAVPLATSAIIEARGALLLYDSEVPIPLSIMHLRRLFNLTPAECDLCTALLDGRSLNAFAAGRGVSRNTARTLLTRIFAKTGKQRQSDLIKMLASLSSLQALGAGFAAGMTAGPRGLAPPQETVEAKLKLTMLTRTGLERFPDLEASVTFGEYTAGGINKRHAHADCLELIFVIQGAISTEIEGEGTKLTEAGAVLCLRPDIFHQGRNASSTEPAKFVLVKLKRRGAATTVVQS